MSVEMTKRGRESMEKALWNELEKFQVKELVALKDGEMLVIKSRKPLCTCLHFDRFFSNFLNRFHFDKEESSWKLA